MISPAALRVETGLICQLRCPLCPTTRNENLEVLGRGSMKFKNFKRLLDQNPQIKTVELANFGEVLLNKDLPKILEYAHGKGVTTTIDEGANMNTASDEVLEALVKFQTRVVRCAIDGITQETYEQYRVGGNLRNVIKNIQKLNAFKEKYQSELPRLIFQFVVFGHNEHQVESAIRLAKILKMELFLKLNFNTHALKVVNRERVRQYLGAADRDEYLEESGKHYKRHQCYEMWNRPQINWNGKLVGCSRNFWGVYAENVFEGSLDEHLNNEQMEAARQALMGLEPARPDLPCQKCGVFQSMVTTGHWITPAEIEENAQTLEEWMPA